ncbi:DUF3576 domain-containing protein [Candidatus Hydrogenosomobacter endosymbioticus]|uniref:Lipoprotein n=1 Tax=Candidatus Hydrogenosomobacter endosymbioticus TaxID=2558174 RepID=A0ABM7V9H8_9PROT|nr:DUF3576 domain-containing protein [Candidatus Hydrogenosomobacter endosymbioticus]BDB96461.1 hypothetical protein HYD_5940 [Candidatus Hydrogenosomobacter endosymbioticus]
MCNKNLYKKLGVFIVAAALSCGCSEKYANKAGSDPYEVIRYDLIDVKYRDVGYLFDNKPIVLYGDDKGCAVDVELWRAAVGVMSRIPLVVADSRGGIIESEWYGPSEAIGEQFKVKVLLRKSEKIDLKAVDVIVLRRIWDGCSKSWRACPDSKALGKLIRDKILCSFCRK